MAHLICSTLTRGLRIGFLFALISLPFSAYSEVAVVVHISNSSSFDNNTVSRIYLGKARTFENGTTAIPISQDDRSPITADFNKVVLKKSSSQLKAYWSKLVFTGKGTPPRSVENDQQVLELVSANPNIIGFVALENVTSTVKVIATFTN